MRVAFQMEPLEATDPAETHTLLLMQEAQDRGYEVWQFHPREVSLANVTPANAGGWSDNRPDAVIRRHDNITALARPVTLQLSNAPHFTYGAAQEISLSEFDVILIRQDPPFDMEYITSTYLLDAVKDKVLVVNNPTSIRNYAEKLYPFAFAEFMPPTLVTYSQERVDAFRAEQGGDVVVKPLYGFHGHGVELIPAGSAYTLPKNLTEPLMFQPFLPEIRQGNKRILFIDGEVDSAIITRPPEGEFRVYRGSTDHAYELTARDKALCAAIGASLKKLGLLFVGIDMIGDYLTEINVTSVGSIRRINAIYGGKCEARIWDAVERRVMPSS